MNISEQALASLFHESQHNWLLVLSVMMDREGTACHDPPAKAGTLWSILRRSSAVCWRVPLKIIGMDFYFQPGTHNWKTVAVCRVCEKVLSFNGGAMSNLQQHSGIHKKKTADMMGNKQMEAFVVTRPEVALSIAVSTGGVWLFQLFLELSKSS